MIGHAWITEGFEDYAIELTGHLPTQGFRANQIVEVLKKLSNGKWQTRIPMDKWGMNIPSEYLEFIPPHYFIFQDAAGDWHAVLPDDDGGFDLTHTVFIK